LSDLSPPTTPPARRKPQILPDDPLLTPKEAAAERGQALSTFWRDVKRGLVPPAIRVGPRMRRWRRSELRADLESRREATR
jgi:predicted DNA-binding transcriptional regulator AlpA